MLTMCHHHHYADFARISSAECIELWIHYAVTDDTIDAPPASTSPPNQHYEYMGFITLSSNASTAYKSRELQSVNVGPRRGTHLKLRLGASHPNPHNNFNQVALIAVNIIGNDLPALRTHVQSPAADNASGGGGAVDAKESDVPAMDDGQTMTTTLQSMCDDLAFSMYVDESVADVVRLMESKKATAVNGNTVTLSVFLIEIGQQFRPFRVQNR